MTDDDKTPALRPMPQPAFADVYASRPAAPEDDPDRARSDAAAQLPSRVPGLDQKQLKAMFEEVLAKDPALLHQRDEVKALKVRISELESQVLALAAPNTLEAQPTDPDPKPKTTPKKKGK